MKQRFGSIDVGVHITQRCSVRELGERYTLEQLEADRAHLPAMQLSAFAIPARMSQVGPSKDLVTRVQIHDKVEQ